MRYFVLAAVIAVLFAAVIAAEAGTEVEEFITGPGKDNSTLIVRCISGKTVKIIVTNKELKEQSIDTIFGRLIAECGK